MKFKRFGVTLGPQPPQQLRRTLHIREEQGHGPGWLPNHITIISSTPATNKIALADGVADLWTARLADTILRRTDRSHVRLYRSDELVALLRDAGFSQLEKKTMYGGGYAIVSGRRTTG